jgi:15-cis-phytoene synthase
MCDDLSNEPGATAAGLERWRQEMVEALDHKGSDNPLWPGFVDTVERYRIPHPYLHDMIDGVSSDLSRTCVETFDELYEYCYKVASVAGLCLVHIFGFSDRRALKLAEKCGIAFQLTNILRDVAEDYRIGRIYLPREDWERFGVTESSFGAPAVSEPLRGLLADYGERARTYYEESRPLLEMVDRSCRGSLWALMQIYMRVLDRITERRYEVLGERVKLSTVEKLLIVVRASWS